MSFLCCFIWLRRNLQPPLLPLKPVAAHTSPLLWKAPVQSWVRHFMSGLGPKTNNNKNIRKLSKFTNKNTSFHNSRLQLLLGRFADIHVISI